MSLVDSRIIKQAQVIVNQSLKVKKGERVIISAEVLARPLVIELYRELIKKGAAEVRVSYLDHELIQAYFEEASPTQIETFPQIEMDEMKRVDCYIRIKASSNTRFMSSIDPSKSVKRAIVTRPITDYRVENTRWVVTNFPTEAQAQEADMSLSEYSNFVFSAINETDWPKLFKQQEALRKAIDRTKIVRIVSSDTDLTLDITGRKAENAGGHFNMPDGEVFTSAQESKTQGFITFNYPALFQGREFHDVRLEFKNGKVIKATASKGEEALNKILDTDPGARRVGELGFGNNYKISRFTKDILFDEKIGGSIHLALGKGYTKTKSRNKSAIHWDMIKDLRSGADIIFDGKIVQKNGKWTANFV